MVTPEKRVLYAANRREKYRLNGDVRKQQKIAWGHENKEAFITSSLKQNAKRRGLDYDIDASDISIPEVCPVFGTPLVFGLGSGEWSRNSISVDRIDSTKGYVKNNVQILSLKANMMKQDATPEELRAFAKWILKTYGE